MKAFIWDQSFVTGLEPVGTAGIDRELAMIDLKREVNALSVQLGRPAPYDVGFAGTPPQDRP